MKPYTIKSIELMVDNWMRDNFYRREINHDDIDEDSPLWELAILDGLISDLRAEDLIDSEIYVASICMVMWNLIQRIKKEEQK